MFKRFLVLILTAVLACTMVLPGFAAAAPNDIAFGLSSVSNVKPGQEFSVTISLTGEAATVCGFDFSVNFNPNLLTYVDASVRSDVFTGAVAYGKTGSVSCVWESTANITAQPGEVFVMNFKATEAFASATTLTLAMGELYQIVPGNELTFATVLAANDNAASATVSPAAAATDPAVTNLVAKITGLGAVEATDSYREKLDSALADYSALSSAQKKQVTNYKELVKKYNDYIAVSTDTSSSAAKQFKKDHAAALTLRTSTVAVTDEAAVAGALSAWEDLPVSTQLELVRERMLLKALDDRIYDLNAENREKEEQEKLQQEAKDAVAEFKKNNAWQLALTVDEVLSGHRAGLAVTKSDLDTIEALHDLAYQILKEDGTVKLVNDLYNKANELYDLENPADLEYILEADNFRSKFGYVLSLAPEDLTYDDIADVNAAYMVYGFLRAKTRSYLTEESQILENLMRMADTLSPEDIPGETVVIPGETVVVPGETVTKVDTVYKDDSLKEAYNLFMGTHSKGKMIGILLIIVIAMVALAIVARIVFWYLKKKEKDSKKNEITEGGAVL